MNLTKTNNVLAITSTPGIDEYALIFIERVFADSKILLYSVISDDVSYTLTTDGYFQVTEIFLPNSNLGGYYTNGTDVFNSLDEEVEFSEILEEVTLTDLEDVLNYYNLKQYYKNLLKDGFLKCVCTCNSTLPNKQVIDTITMGLFLIEILEEEELFYEAQRIIDSLVTCNYINYSNCNCNG